MTVLSNSVQTAHFSDYMSESILDAFLILISDGVEEEFVTSKKMPVVNSVL